MKPARAMTPARLAFASLVHYRRTHAAAALGVAASVAVLAGSLLVGHSVRASLEDLAASRLGRTDVIVSSEIPFTASLADRLRDAPGLAQESAMTAAVLTLPGTVLHERSGRRANSVQVYGVSDRFFALHGVPPRTLDRSDMLVSADLGAELSAADGDALVLRVVKPTDIPADSMHGRREEIGRSIRLTSRGILPREAMGDFSLLPQQGAVRAAFVPLERLERDINQSGRANLLLVAASHRSDTITRVRTALETQLSPEDLGLRAAVAGDPGVIVLETSSGLIPDAMASAVFAAAGRTGLSATGVFTWLANRMTINGRAVPYSLVTAIDRGPTAEVPPGATGSHQTPPIALSEWAANDLGAKPGATLELEYFQWTDAGTLETRRTSFHVTEILPMRGLAVDRRLAPDYPGISDAKGLADWDPPFPVDLKLVRPIDEDYWDRYQTSPKAFIPLAAGQQLWGTRHGKLSSIRLSKPAGSVSQADADALLADVARAMTPAAAGLTIVDVRAQAATASAGATDFGAYFSYFSFFLMVSALLLAALFFRLSVEQRLPQIGVLRAIGLSLSAIRRVWLIEGAVIALAGAAAGAVLAIAWAQLMMFGLRTWWVDAVGTRLLTLHVDALSLAIGALGAALAGVAATAWTVRGLSKKSPRQLLSGSVDAGQVIVKKEFARTRLIATVSLLVAVLLAVTGALGYMPAAGAFFGAGTLVLIGGLAVMANALRHPTGFLYTLRQLAVRNASWRPGRSLTAAGLVASAVFLIIAVESFRKGDASVESRIAGTGGFSVIAESALPIVHDPSSAAGREALGLHQTTSDTSLDSVEIVPFRLRPGDDTSCLALYIPRRPRVLGVGTRFIDGNRFQFSASVAETDAERANPWRLLADTGADGVTTPIPAIVDQTSLQYVLHAGVGDVITIDEDTSRPLKLRIVGALADSLLQSELLIGDAAFRRVYPQIAGFRVFLAGSGGLNAAQAATALEERLAPFGLDAVDAASRLAAFHRVENTYLSTFQALGALGLLLGFVGLAAVIARNVFERRRELALFGAAGYTGKQLQSMVLIEHLTLVGAGLLIGLIAAAIAVAPVAASRGVAQPARALAWLGLVAVVAFVVTAAATRAVRRLPLVASLRSE